MSGRWSSVVTLAGVELRRFVRDRSNIFFVFVFPLLIVLIVGIQFSDVGQRSRVVVGGPESDLRSALVEALEDGDVETGVSDAETAREQVARAKADAAVILDEDAAEAFDSGEPVQLELIPGSRSSGPLASQRVGDAVRSLATEEAQRDVLVAAGVDPGEVDDLLVEAEEVAGDVVVEVVDLDEVSQQFEGVEGMFDIGAGQQLLLFVFLSSLSGSATLIQSRSLGVVPRVLSAPVTTGTVIVGQALGRFAIAFVQGAYIMLGTSLLFGVSWGNLGLALVVLVLFCAVSAAAAMVLGSVFDNESVASGVGVGAGLVVGGLGGSMLPLELMPEGMRTVANLTPHAWAYEAFAELQRRAGTFADIAPSLGVLALMAVVLLALGGFLLRRSLGRAI